MIKETTHVFIMARGQGTRLQPLTDGVCKSSVPFGGKHKIIDFILSNLAAAEITNITILGPSEAPTLSKHLEKYWPEVVLEKSSLHEPLIGNAASVRMALEANMDKNATHIGIFPSDQILLFDQREVLLHHIQTKSKASILTQLRDPSTVSNFGVLHVEGESIVDFLEKPSVLPKQYINNHQCRINMGIYWFDRKTLYRTLLKDAKNTSSSNDFGHNVLPLLIKESSTKMIDIDPNYPWEDVGTIERYWNAHWKYKGDIHNWNIKVTSPVSIVSNGYSVSPIPDSTTIFQCIILDSVIIGEHCDLKHLIIDSGCILENDLMISLDTPISGTVYRTPECIIIPKRSLVRYNKEKQIITVAPR